MEDKVRHELETRPEVYGKHYSEENFWRKLGRIAAKVGIRLTYEVLLLYYVLESPGTSRKDRTKILGALGYLILPLDLIPDWLPAFGYTDDLAAVTWALYMVAKLVTPEVKAQAAAKCRDWFGDFDPAILKSIL